MPRRPKKHTDLATWLGTASTPLFVLDPERRIRVFNAGCQSLTGWTAADVVGVVCQYASVADVTGGVALAANLCPPPEVFAGQELATPAQIVLRDGDVAARTIHYFPLLDPQRQLTGVLGLIGEPAAPGATQTIPATHRLHAELAALRGALRQRFGQQSLVASSLAMHRVLAQLDLAVRTNTFALLVGEPGTGREHLARVIHFGGAARGQWFIPLDCRRMAADEL
ncbi:MAG: sigma 54-interacting transcriptional regulator, partial [Planctomycetota bacterium]|nr:sigma 54-interacting transcriptional regulator [Planctomycetota bacterium]